MSGNVWEWCRDTYHDDAYHRHESDNPVLEVPQTHDRVIRGGSWNLDAWSLRCARRFSFSEDYLGAGLGFRLILMPRSNNR
jgi:formylglycine-generating enzyme required for sulfatase activity